MAKKRFSLFIDEDVISDFKKYCEDNAFKISSKVELLLKKEMRNPKRDDKDLRQYIVQMEKPGPITTPERMIQKITGQTPKELSNDNPKMMSDDVPSIDTLRVRKRL